MGLVLMKCLSIYNLKNYLLHLQYWKIFFTLYRIQGWCFFPLLMIYCFAPRPPPSYWRKFVEISATLIFAVLYVPCLLLPFKDLIFILILNSLIIMCFGVIFFMFLLIAIYWAFWFCGFIFFINCRNYLPFFWNLLFYSLYFIFLLRTSTRPIIVQFSSVQSLSHVWLFVTPWTTAHQASLSNTNTQNLLKLKSIELMMPPNHLFLCHPLLLLPSIFPSTRVFSNESVLCIRWPKYWNCRFSISPSNEYSGLISFRIGWLDLLAVQGPLKSIFQHHSSKASILLRFLYSPTSTSIHDYWKTIALTRQTFVGKMVSWFILTLIRQMFRLREWRK